MSVSAEGTDSFAGPFIDGALPDIPDGQHNLLPTTQLNRPLHITIVEAPIVPEPPPGRPVELLIRVGLRGTSLVSAGSQIVMTPIQLPVTVEIPSEYFITEGIYEVRVRLTYAGVSQDSDPSYFEVDKTSPNNGSPAAPPIVPDEVVRDGLTTDYLEKNQDRVIIKVPRYMDQRRGDVIRLYFGSFSEPVSTAEIDDSTSDTPIELTGDAVRKLNNGNWPVFYTLKDRADNESGESRSKSIDVRLT